MISSEALKNALSKPSCISISSTAKPILSLDRSSRGLFANKFRQASGTNPLDMSGPRHIPHGYFRWDASAMNAHSSERRSPLTRRWSGQDSNFESLHGKLAEPRIKTRAVGPRWRQPISPAVGALLRGLWPPTVRVLSIGFYHQVPEAKVQRTAPGTPHSTHRSGQIRIDGSRYAASARLYKLIGLGRGPANRMATQP